MMKALIESPELLPECAVCAKPVDRVSMTENLFGPSRYRYRVECHGQVEEFGVEEVLLVSSVRFVIGKAFVQKALPEGE